MDMDQEGQQVAILANPIAGSASSPKLLDELVNVLAAQGLIPTVCRRPEELSILAAEQPNPLRCVVAMGGDGTLAEVLNRAPRVPVAIFPMGNENLVARHFGCRKSSSLLGQTVVAARPRHLDLGIMNGRHFTLMAGIGFDAEVVRRVHRQRRGHVNKLSYAVATLLTLRHYDFPTVEVQIEDSGEWLRGALIMVFNLPVYALGLPVAAKADPGDGFLDLFVFQRPGIRNLLRYIYAISKGRQARLTDLQHRLVKRVFLRSEKRVPIQIDGDPAGFLPATIEVAPGSWRLLAPGPSKESGG